MQDVRAAGLADQHGLHSGLLPRARSGATQSNLRFVRSTEAEADHGGTVESAAPPWRRASRVGCRTRPRRTRSDSPVHHPGLLSHPHEGVARPTPRRCSGDRSSPGVMSWAPRDGESAMAFACRLRGRPPVGPGVDARSTSMRTRRTVICVLVPPCGGDARGEMTSRQVHVRRRQRSPRCKTAFRSGTGIAPPGFEPGTSRL
jgi:hypothetical protein